MPNPSATNFFSASGAWTMSTSTSQLSPSLSALPVPVAVQRRSIPVAFLNSGAITLSSPVSSVLVVVAISRTFSWAPAKPAGIRDANRSNKTVQ